MLKKILIFILFFVSLYSKDVYFKPNVPLNISQYINDVVKAKSVNISKDAMMYEISGLKWDIEAISNCKIIDKSYLVCNTSKKSFPLIISLDFGDIVKSKIINLVNEEYKNVSQKSSENDVVKTNINDNSDKEDENSVMILTKKDIDIIKQFYIDKINNLKNELKKYKKAVILLKNKKDQLSNENSALKNELESVNEKLNNVYEEIKKIHEKNLKLSSILADEKNKNKILNEKLNELKNKLNMCYKKLKNNKKVDKVEDIISKNIIF